MGAVFILEYIVIPPGISQPWLLKFYWQQLEVIDEILSQFSSFNYTVFLHQDLFCQCANV